MKPIEDLTGGLRHSMIFITWLGGKPLFDYTVFYFREGVHETDNSHQGLFGTHFTP